MRGKEPHVLTKAAFGPTRKSEERGISRAFSGALVISLGTTLRVHLLKGLQTTGSWTALNSLQSIVCASSNWGVGLRQQLVYFAKPLYKTSSGRVFFFKSAPTQRPPVVPCEGTRARLRYAFDQASDSSFALVGVRRKPRLFFVFARVSQQRKRT